MPTYNLPVKCDFNPRTHRGVRRYQYSYNHCLTYYFNPRTHRGVRPFVCIALFTLANFNPRTHRGVRPSTTIRFTSACLRFQSTHPSWGATLTPGIHKICRRYFNPRTHRGVRPGDFNNKA